MSTITDLTKERQISCLIDRLGEHIASNPEIAERTYAYLDGELPVKRDNTVMISVRVPADLVTDIDAIAREIAYHEGRRVNRNSLLVDIMRRFVSEHRAALVEEGK